MKKQWGKLVAMCAAKPQGAAGAIVFFAVSATFWFLVAVLG